MSEEFESLNSRIPDFSSVLLQRAMAKKNDINSTALSPPGTIDPYTLLLKKKQAETAEVDPKTIVKWPDESHKKLQDYCAKMGIVGFSAGLMNPIAALAMLKKQFGEDYTDVPLENRIPAGYEKSGTHSGYGPNYPYSQAISKKQILHG
jgi:hypothetical protein